MNEYDNVSNPAHYCEGREYEPKDVIRDWGLNFNLGNAVKYISRAGRKDDVVEDLNKAIQYINFEIGAIKRVQHKYIERKTYRKDFLEKFPVTITEKMENGLYYPIVKPCCIYPGLHKLKVLFGKCKNCSDCWDLVMDE